MPVWVHHGSMVDEDAQVGRKTRERPSAGEALDSIASSVKSGFVQEKRVLSFDEYLELFQKQPAQQCRDASSYVLAMIEHFGSERVTTALGTHTRYGVFDQRFLSEADASAQALVGQSLVQEQLVSKLQNFRREGRCNRVLLMHGPNGSAKSTMAACLMGGLEYYSTLEEGALYRFHWVFPKKTQLRGAIGFGGAEKKNKPVGESFAHLSDDEMETRLVVEMRDHPLFLLPHQQRQKLLAENLESGALIPRWISHGSLCQKNQQIFTALLNSYGGDLRELLRHVQVERYFVSRRYRVGAVTLGPALSVDARERQVTADQNWGVLPASLQGLSLFDAGGELVDATGGILELSDLLKRPVDAYKYLQISAESGEVSLGSQSLELNCVLLASCNELHLAAFREHPEFESFRGRFELIQVPYLRDYVQEKRIYDAQVASRVSCDVAPHATAVAARFAVLTRLRKPDKASYDEEHRAFVDGISVWEKMQAYAGEITELQVAGRRLSLSQLTVTMAKEWEESQHYEGISGVSARTMRGILLAAAQHHKFDYLSPFAVLEELDRLCERSQDFSFLNMKVEAGGYSDHRLFRERIRAWLFDTAEEELRAASGLVEETRYDELFARYVSHVSAALKGEKLKNSVTGQLEPADEALMGEVEKLLGTADDAAEARAVFMGRIAAWAIEHPGQKITQAPIYQEKLNSLRTAVYQERRSVLAKICHDLMLATEGKEAIQDEQLAQTFRSLCERYSYSRRSMHDMFARLWNERFRS